ncbi:uncharacterized protein LOC126969844 isoform X3 [Leptidea sinapis]|uniref:uncharacterized protein LOC126969844 isoform X3 n=1 Tax=Leptidea sinapis TaxID=189913 RepID=UPI0021C332A6|nr:uncharacterized protein LOC126969844 isoform X3 [Leptidea sinapis]
MPFCSVKWCGKRSTTSSLTKDGTTFHRFPKCPKLKEKWIIATCRDSNWFPGKNNIHVEQKNVEATIVPELSTSNWNTTAYDVNDTPMPDDDAEYEVIIKSEVESDDEDPREPTSQLPQATKCSAPLLQPSTSTKNFTNRVADPPIPTNVQSASDYEISVSNTQPETLRRFNVKRRNSSELGNLQNDHDILEWAMKLARMSPQQRLFAKKAINAVIYEAELGNLHEDSVCINKCNERH